MLNKGVSIVLPVFWASPNLKSRLEIGTYCKSYTTSACRQVDSSAISWGLARAGEFYFLFLSRDRPYLPRVASIPQIHLSLSRLAISAKCYPSFEPLVPSTSKTLARLNPVQTERADRKEHCCQRGCQNTFGSMEKQQNHSNDQV
jgi:hypothetical protein